MSEEEITEEKVREKWDSRESALALLKASFLIADRLEFSHARRSDIEKKDKWVMEQIHKLAKILGETQGSAKSDGSKVLNLENITIKMNANGEVDYLRFDDGFSPLYIISSRGNPQGSPADRLAVLWKLAKHVRKILEYDRVLDELKVQFDGEFKELEGKGEEILKHRDKLEAVATKYGKMLVDYFGYCKSSNCYYITDVKSGGREKTLEIKVERGYLKYIKLGEDYIVSEFTKPYMMKYKELIDVLRGEIKKNIERFDRELGELDTEALPEEYGERAKQYRTLLTRRITEMGMKIAMWYGEQTGNASYSFNGKVNYNGAEKPIVIKIDKGELSYLKIGERYILSKYGNDKPYLSWLVNTHKALYTFIISKNRKIDEAVEEAGAYERIPVEAVVKKTPQAPIQKNDIAFEEEEARILLPKEEHKTDVIVRNVVSFKDGSKLVWDIVAMKEVKVRKPHSCEKCGRVIDKGEKALVITERTKRGRFVSHYYCSDDYEIKEEVIQVSSKAPAEKKKEGVEIGL